MYFCTMRNISMLNVVSLTEVMKSFWKVNVLLKILIDSKTVTIIWIVFCDFKWHTYYMKIIVRNFIAHSVQENVNC